MNPTQKTIELIFMTMLVFVSVIGCIWPKATISFFYQNEKLVNNELFVQVNRIICGLLAIMLLIGVISALVGKLH